MARRVPCGGGRANSFLIDKLLKNNYSFPDMKTPTEKEKVLEKFAKEYDKLMKKYPEIMVGGNTNGDLVAYIADGWQTKQVKL
jgi:hypothetical protein